MYKFDTHRGKPKCSTSQFTQAVWKGSTELGIGIASGKDEKGMTCTAVVGRYRGKGNQGRLNEYKDNVPQGTFTDTVCSSLDKLVKEVEASVAKESRTVDKGAAYESGSDVTDTVLKDDKQGFVGGAAPSEGATGTNFQQVGLAAHNKFREIHETPAMTLNAKMCDEAEAYAKTLAKLGKLQHASSEERRGDGENLAYSCSSEPGAVMTAGQATANWYIQLCFSFFVFNLVFYFEVYNVRYMTCPISSGVVQFGL